MWIPTRPEAIEMFARHFEARHRGGALRQAKETAAAMKIKGDLDGYDVWNNVANVIDSLRHDERVTVRRTTETT